MKEQNVTAIQEGMVIDHIPSEYTFKVAELLNLEMVASTVIIASNLQSKKMSSKGLIKVAGMNLENELLKKIALIAPQASISVIKNYQIVEKTKLPRPNEISNLLRCINPNCIANKENMKTHFTVEKEQPLILRCRYCERSITRHEMELL